MVAAAVDDIQWGEKVHQLLSNAHVHSSDCLERDATIVIELLCH